MSKKLLLILLIMPLVFSGCKNSHRVETAAVIENVSVERQNGQLCYTFYLLTEEETPNAVSIPADSFQEAQKLARRSYIPNLTLAKLKLLLIHKDVVSEILQTDIEYISTQASFSPVAYVALCDDNALRRVRQNTRAQTMIERQLILCKQQHPQVNIDYLSVFNSYARKNEDGFYLPYITAEGDLRVSERKIEN